MKKILAVFTVIIVILSVNIYAYGETDVGEMTDEIGVLSADDIAQLNEFFQQVREEHNIDVRGLIVNDIGSKSMMEFADDYYEEKDFGLGSNHDGVMLVVDLGSRKWWITTEGYGIRAVTDYGIDKVGENIVSSLKNEDYYSAFKTYGELIESYCVFLEEKGEPLDSHNDKGEYELQPYLIGGVVIGVIAGFMSSNRQKRKLKSVEPQYNADTYVCKSSVSIDEAEDVFLYDTVMKHKKSDESSGGGGGSSVHTSSSGRTHGGGGGSF